MLEELRVAGNILNDALDRYLNACSSVQQHCYKRFGSSNVSQEAVNLIANELLLNAYRTKFQQADATISQVRNTIPTIVPAGMLPGEILSRIFYFVTYGKSCKFHQTYKYPTYPTLFTRVCSRWRQVALSSPTLWSHIDISTHGFRGLGETNERHLAHAKTCLARAGHTHLDIHVAEDFPYGLYIGDPGLADFRAPLANRIRSLEIYVQLDDYDRPNAHLFGGNLCNEILYTCLVGCTPGVLKRLVIMPEGCYGRGMFLQAEETPDVNGGNGLPRDTVKLDMKEKELEDLLSPVTNLKLTGRYPPWSSKAFHGLTELRLHQSDSVTHLPSHQFLAILAASPRLDTLEFDLEIEIWTPGSIPSPVPLNNLRTLIVNTTSPNTFLPLIDPGPGPITFSLLNPRAKRRK